jgi:hypothetical protein
MKTKTVAAFSFRSVEISAGAGALWALRPALVGATDSTWRLFRRDLTIETSSNTLTEQSNLSW